MTWASNYITKLKRGESVTFRAKGHSMTGKIDHNTEVTIIPVDRPLRKGDIVLCRVHGAEYLHLVKGMKKTDEKKPGQFLIGNNRGGTNGWTGRDKIYGLYLSPEEAAEREAKKTAASEAAAKGSPASG
jgi:hypothetical protein